MTSDRSYRRIWPKNRLPAADRGDLQRRRVDERCDDRGGGGGGGRVTTTIRASVSLCVVVVAVVSFFIEFVVLFCFHSDTFCPDVNVIRYQVHGVKMISFPLFRETRVDFVYVCNDNVQFISLGASGTRTRTIPPLDNRWDPLYSYVRIYGIYKNNELNRTDIYRFTAATKSLSGTARGVTMLRIRATPRRLSHRSNRQWATSNRQLAITLTFNYSREN